MKNNIKWLLLIFTFGIFTSNVNAEETEYVKIVDNDGYSISAGNTFGDVPKLKMTLNGIKEDGDFKYYVKFVNENDEMPNLDEFVTSYGCFLQVGELREVYKDSGNVDVADDWYILSGYDYAYIIKRDNNSMVCEMTREPVKVTRPDLPKLGERYDISFNDPIYGYDKNSMYIFPQFPHYGKMGSHMLNVKVGVINDNDVLSKLANNTSDSLTSLMEYAKKNDGKIYQLVDNEYGLENSGLDIIPNAYYYIYTTYENEDGLYRDLSDIVVVQADEYGNRLSIDVRWRLPEVPKAEITNKEELKQDATNVETTVENPKTGLYISLGVLVVAICSGVFYIVYRKKNYFNKI